MSHRTMREIVIERRAGIVGWALIAFALLASACDSGGSPPPTPASPTS